MAKRLWSFTKGSRFLTLICPFMIYLDVYIEVQLPLKMADIIDLIEMLGKSGADTTVIRGQLSTTLLEMLGLCTLTIVAGYIAARCSAIASMGFGANLRSSLFGKIQDLSFENIDKIKISSLITRMTSDVSSIQNVYKNTLVTFIKGPLMLVEALRVSIGMSKEIAVVFWFAIPGIVVALVFMGFLAVPLFKKMLKKTDRFNAVLRGNINGIRVVKSFVREDHERDKFEEANVDVMKMNERAQALILYVTPAITFIMYACVVFAMWRGSELIIEGQGFTKGELMAYITNITQVLSSLMTVLLIFLTMFTAKASIDRMNEVFRQEPSVSDKEADPSLKLADGSIEYKAVSFRYDEAVEKKILDGVDLKIESGETVGIIGSTGSSKSTLIYLIPRLYDVNEGEVCVGGNNVKNYTFENLRGEISVVLQQSTLFSGTIMDNLRWGNPDATDEEVIEAAKAAQAHDFISEFEKGYETELGQGGNTVSGGQRQRLCIARALLKKSKILILDDCTSAVDTATDAKIRMALRSERFAGMTKIIIAQRITSIMDADRIIVIEDGKIAGTGTHDELKESNEIYREIFISQQEGVLAQ